LILIAGGSGTVAYQRVPRFTLRTLLAVVTLTAIGMGMIVNLGR
jgi:hypothetical protein